MSTCVAVNGFESFGCWMGNISALIYFFVQLPQIYKNWQRKSTAGFSPYFLIIRFIGLSFFVVNGTIEKSPMSLLVSGYLILLTFSLLIVQHAYYNFSFQFYFVLLFPLFPALLSSFVKSSIEFTNYINPISQILCYIPFVYECLKSETTKGISLLSQHINFLGSILGIMMCTITCQCSTVGWTFHIVSMFQSIIIYLLAIDYDEFQLIDIKSEFKNRPHMSDLEQIMHPN